MYLGKDEVGLGKRESVEDVGRVLTRMVDVLIVRTFDPVILKGLADSCTIPVINALDDAEHPCQAFADFLTMQEHLGDITGKILTYIGDGNNVAASLMLLAPKLGVHFRIACPDGYLPDPHVWARAAELAAEHGTKMERFSVPSEAATGADAIYTDVWTSMGFEAENEARQKAFADWRVDNEMLAVAQSDVLFMHCLPAHRGEEVDADVIDGPQSVVWDEAENRMHVQKALMEYLLLGRVA